MTNISNVETLSLGNRRLLGRRENHWRQLTRLLDALPWWVVVALAGLTYWSLHHLANPDAVDVFEPRMIMRILASAGQYLFPMLLLVEALALVSRRHVQHKPRVAQTSEAIAPATGNEEVATSSVQAAAQQAPRAWSLALLNRLDAQHFVDLARHYYRERDIRCAATPGAVKGSTVLKLFQDEGGQVSGLVQFRAQGSPWVGASQVRALQEMMAAGKLAKGIFMTPGAFSKDAKECAQAYGISLIDGKLFLLMIKRLPADAQRRLLAFALGED